MTETFRERSIRAAENSEKLESMLKQLGHADNKGEMQQLAVSFYIPDLSYARHDICLAMKVLEIENGW